MKCVDLIEGFYRRDVDWPRIVDNLLSSKKLTVRYTDHEHGDTREITTLCGQQINISVDCLGGNPHLKKYTSVEKKMLKLHQKLYRSIPLIAIYPRGSCKC